MSESVHVEKARSLLRDLDEAITKRNYLNATYRAQELAQVLLSAFSSVLKEQR